MDDWTNDRLGGLLASRSEDPQRSVLLRNADIVTMDPHLTKSAAGEYANLNIRIDAVAPGAIDTPLVAPLSAGERAFLMAPQPLQRYGTPDEVAEAVLWLSSSRSAFVLGTVLAIDGGANANTQSYDPMTSPGLS